MSVVLPVCQHGSVELSDICNFPQDNGPLPDKKSLESQRQQLEIRLSAAVEAENYIGVGFEEISEGGVGGSLKSCPLWCSHTVSLSPSS